MQVGDLQLLVLGKVGILLHDDDTLVEQIFVDFPLVLLRYQNHFFGLVRLIIYIQ